MQTTLDGILNKRITVEQPKEGFRIAVDTILLAASVPAEARQSVIDMGCGVGGAMLALACRVPHVRIVGVECQGILADLCRANIERNKLQAELVCEVGDVRALGDGESFDHVMMNPPYHDVARHDVSPNVIKRVADAEGEASIEDWITAAAQALKPDGGLTLIHRADRVEEILGCLKKHFKGWLVKPLFSKEGRESTRIIIRAFLTRDERRFCSPLVLHQASGAYTNAMEGILRRLEPVDFTK